MNKQIISDIQIMANAENKIGEISDRVRSVQSEYKKYPESYDSGWKGKAAKKMSAKINVTSRALGIVSAKLSEEKSLIETARKNYEKAENVSSQVVGKAVEKVLSTANMFKN